MATDGHLDDPLLGSLYLLPWFEEYDVRVAAHSRKRRRRSHQHEFVQHPKREKRDLLAACRVCGFEMPLTARAKIAHRAHEPFCALHPLHAEFCHDDTT